MSSFIQPTVHPRTKVVETAEWLDDYFGRHEYGVRFPSDGLVFKASDFDWEKRPSDLADVGRCKVTNSIPATTEKGPYIRFPHETDTTIEEGEDGKRTVVTKHHDGSQDVRVEVTRLDLHDRTPEDDKAEAAIIERLAKEKVGVLIIHAETRDKVYFTCPLTQVRANAEMVIGQFLDAHPDLRDKGTDQFIIVESAVVNKVPTVSKL